MFLHSEHALFVQYTVASLLTKLRC